MNLNDAILRVIEATKEVENGRVFGDEEDLFTRNEMIKINACTSRTQVESRLLPLVVKWADTHMKNNGWIYPPVTEVPEMVLQALRKNSGDGTDEVYSSTKSTGSTYLKSEFKSFWDVDKGPTHCTEKLLSKVIAYRMGLNTSKLYTYKVDGEEVSVQETFDINFSTIRRGFVVGHSVPSFFKPAIACAIYRRWLGDVPSPTVWDPSSGFGARMLGFFAAYPGGTYIGNEPASKIRADLTRVAGLLNGNSVIRPEGSELKGVGPKSVDMVFTSPPYFDLEKWYKEPGQCWLDYPNMKSWSDNYWIPTLRHAAEGIKPGGKVVINIGPAYRDLTIRLALGVGLKLQHEQQLSIGRDAFSRKKGKVEGRFEPILIFGKN